MISTNDSRWFVSSTPEPKERSSLRIEKDTLTLVPVVASVLFFTVRLRDRSLTVLNDHWAESRPELDRWKLTVVDNWLAGRQLSKLDRGCNDSDYRFVRLPVNIYGNRPSVLQLLVYTRHYKSIGNLAWNILECTPSKTLNLALLEFFLHFTLKWMACVLFALRTDETGFKSLQIYFISTYVIVVSTRNNNV